MIKKKEPRKKNPFNSKRTRVLKTKHDMFHSNTTGHVVLSFIFPLVCTAEGQTFSLLWMPGKSGENVWQGISVKIITGVLS